MHSDQQPGSYFSEVLFLKVDTSLMSYMRSFIPNSSLNLIKCYDLDNSSTHTAKKLSSGNTVQLTFEQHGG